MVQPCCFYLFAVLKTSILIIAVFLVGFSVQGLAQLSPGDLANSHKHLEGMSNCTQCHDLGNKVTNQKCLACHQEIDYRISRNMGYHASSEVKTKECADCHSDHHGRNFDMVRFDEKKFNHQLTGYDLTGKHQQIDCRACHKPDYVQDGGLKKRSETFLGLSQACVSCHADYHQKTLGSDCAKCHSTDQFAPANRFNHDRADFPLLGKHKSVDCIECHQKELKNGTEFQRFSGVPFTNCNSCHDDPHQNQLGSNCKSCHTEQSFTAHSALVKFNHTNTAFPLKGKHKQTACFDCHKPNQTALLVFQDRLGIRPNDCKTCHEDVHKGRFGESCVDCHNESTFKTSLGLDKFDHNRTDYPLTGKHVQVDCKKCHTSEKMTDPLPFNTCASCHNDYHEGQFVTPVKTQDCSECHSTDGFDIPMYTVESHAKTAFPLDGAHLAVPCFSCHVKNEKWQFRELGTRCIDCHQDVHNGQIAEKWYPAKACEQCHVSSSWKESRFKHELTGFELLGAHAEQSCSACHFPEGLLADAVFENLPKRCEDCHSDQHFGQFKEKEGTDCSKCHSSNSWAIPQFNHDKTRFKLEGKHAEVACEKCHLTVVVNNNSYIQYKFERFECVVCHQ